MFNTSLTVSEQSATLTREQNMEKFLTHSFYITELGIKKYQLKLQILHKPEK